MVRILANVCQSVYVCFYQTYQAQSRQDLPSSAYSSPCPLLPENRSDDLVASTLPSPVSLSLVQKGGKNMYYSDSLWLMIGKKHHAAPICVTLLQDKTPCCSNLCYNLTGKKIMLLQFVLHFYKIKHYVASIYVTVWQEKHTMLLQFVTLLQDKTPCCSSLCYNLKGKNIMLLQSVLHFYRIKHYVASIYVTIWQEKTPCRSNLYYNLTGKNTMLL